MNVSCMTVRRIGRFSSLCSQGFVVKLHPVLCSRSFSDGLDDEATIARTHPNFDKPKEFKPLNIKGDKEKKVARREFVDVTHPPRVERMDPDHTDWTQVWPTAAPFRHSSVPFPVKMGVARNRAENDGVAPDKSVNVELVKVSNFLHLTPKHVEQHCKVLKQFCTPWPEGLETDEDFEKHFPVEITTRDFVYNWSLRDERSKTNEFKVKLSSLDLDYHARDKLVRLAEGRMTLAPSPEEIELQNTQIGVAGDTPRNLKKEKSFVGNLYRDVTVLNEQKVSRDGVLRWRRRRRYGWWDRKKHWLHPEVAALQEDLPDPPPIASYDYDSDTLTLRTDRCPTRKQNYDHAVFLLKALYGEALRTEPWEAEKEFADLERFIWEKSPSRDVVLKIYRAAHKTEASDDEILTRPEVKEYKAALEDMLNYGESEERLIRYKNAVKILWALKN